MTIRVFSDEEYHLMTPLPPKVWHRPPLLKGLMYCKNCHKTRYFCNPYKYLELIGIKQTLKSAYFEKWICEMCNKSDY